MEAAIKIFDRGDFAAALPMFITLIDDDCVEAYSFAGNIFEKGGSGIEQDFPKAFFYYTKASEHGDVEGYLGLGRLYYYGHGVNQDYDEVFKCYSALLQANYQSAVVYLMLGRMYERGTGTHEDIDKAREYYKKAADQGNVFAVSHLGLLEMGRGHYLKGLSMRIHATLKGVLISIRNTQDPRLRSC